jgi:hypothetical protein
MALCIDTVPECPGPHSGGSRCGVRIFDGPHSVPVFIVKRQNIDTVAAL